jgi:glycine cleavage system H protein
MTDRVWRGCVVPDDRLYDVQLHVWVVPEGDEVVLGMTDVAQSMGGRMVQVSWKKIGRQVRRGQSLAVVESAKWVGPFPTPLSGVLVATNAAAFAEDVTVANRDPYGRGWLARLRPSGFAQERHHLSEGAPAFEAYRRYIDDNAIHCFRCAD